MLEPCQELAPISRQDRPAADERPICKTVGRRANHGSDLHVMANHVSLDLGSQSSSACGGLDADLVEIPREGRRQVAEGLAAFARTGREAALEERRHGE